MYVLLKYLFYFIYIINFERVIADKTIILKMAEGISNN